MKITKIISVLLCVIMLLTVLVGCEQKKAETLLTQAGVQMLDKQFTMTMTMDYSCNDAELNEAFATVSDTETVIVVDGKNVRMDMTVMDQQITVLCVNNIVYMDIFGMKVKSFLSDEDYAEMFSENAELADMDLEDFISIKVEDSANGGKTIICKGFSEELASAMTEGAGAVDGVQNIDVDEEGSNVTINLDKDGNFESIAIELTMTLLVVDKGYVTVDASMDYTFDYTKGEKLTYPEDADQYGTIDPDYITE